MIVDMNDRGELRGEVSADGTTVNLISEFAAAEGVQLGFDNGGQVMSAPGHYVQEDGLHYLLERRAHVTNRERHVMLQSAVSGHLLTLKGNE